MSSVLSLSQPPPKSSKTLMSFNPQHASEYGILVSCRHPTTGDVLACVCRFCGSFGREVTNRDAESRKRKKTTKIHHYRTFRTDLYNKHLDGCHKEKWNAYQKLLTDDDREAFFGVTVPYRDTLLAHFESGSPELHIALSKTIVEDVIGGLLFESDDVDVQTKTRAMAIFEHVDGVRYQVKIKTFKRFNLLVKTVALGASFRLAARIVDVVRDETGMSVYTGCTDALASTYCRVVCASALQQISKILTATSGFSVAMDSSTLYGHSYLDVRVRVVVDGAIQNLHLLALPLYEAHTGENMCGVLVKLLSAVCPRWRDTMVGVSTDGEAKMTGRKRGLATLIEQQTTSKRLIRVWCGLHQLDLVMQKVYKAALSDAFLSTLTAAIGHLRRQQLLITEMKTTCPKVADTRWLSMFACTSWLTSNMVRIQAHYETRQPRPLVVPDVCWWLFLFAVHAIAQEANTVFIKLQAHETLITQQKAALMRLSDTYIALTGIEGPMPPDYFAGLTEAAQMTLEENSGYVLTHAATEIFLVELDPSIEPRINTITEEEKTKLLSAVAKMSLAVVCGIKSIVAERDTSNAAAPEILPVLPHHLIALRMPEFNQLIAKHRSRLEVVMDAASIYQIGQQFVQLKRSYRTDEAVSAEVNRHTDIKATFESAWALIGAQYPRLRQFCGDIATAFPNTATVESDFSVMGWEKDDYRRSLTDFALEGVLHAKQYQLLQRLC